MKNLKRFIFIFVCVLICSVFCGCQNQDLKIHKETTTETWMKDAKQANQAKGVLKKSSGVIIYKENSANGSSTFGEVKFGPKDINFDLPARIK